MTSLLRASIILKTCGTVEAPFLSEAEDQVRSGADDLFITGQLRITKPGHILPGLIRQNARCMMEAILFIGFLNINPDSMIGVHLRVNDLSGIVQS